MRTTWMMCTMLVLVTCFVPAAFAEDSSASGGLDEGGDDPVPCYAIDWTTNPPSIYEVPCPG